MIGVLWDPKLDVLFINLTAFQSLSIGPVTKRKLLPFVQKLFDPIDILSRFLLFPELILQDAWKKKMVWDSALPEQFHKIFNH